MICFAHRGASGYEPENTLRSFQRAVELGSTWVELDVHLAEDRVVVIHDNELRRTTNGSGLVSDSSFDYLRSLDAGEGEQIPTLTEVLDLLDGRCAVNIELKGNDTAKPVAQLLDEALQGIWSVDQFLVSSFNLHELSLMSQRYRRGALFGKKREYFETTETLGAYSLNLPVRLVTEAVVREAHQQGLQVYVYTVNDRDTFQQLRTVGVNGIFSDFPDQALAWIDEG